MLNYVLWSILGLCLGSFYTVIVTRRGRNPRSLLVRSYCDHCDHKLSLLDLIPLLSFSFLKGKCRWCRRRISLLYPLLEAGTAGLLVMCVQIFSDLDFALYAFLIYSVLFLIALVDVRDKIIPDDLLMILASLSLLRVFIEPDPFQLLFCAASLGGLFATFRLLSEKFYKAPLLGWGDVKLVAVLGLWLEWAHVPILFIYAGCFGLLFGFFWYWWRQEKEFPFAPSLILATLLV